MGCNDDLLNFSRILAFWESNFLRCMRNDRRSCRVIGEGDYSMVKKIEKLMKKGCISNKFGKKLIDDVVEESRYCRVKEKPFMTVDDECRPISFRPEAEVLFGKLTTRSYEAWKMLREAEMKECKELKEFEKNRIKKFVGDVFWGWEEQKLKDVV